MVLDFFAIHNSQNLHFISLLGGPYKISLKRIQDLSISFQLTGESQQGTTEATLKNILTFTCCF